MSRLTSRAVFGLLLASASVAAYADTIQQGFTVSGDTGSGQLVSGNFGVNSSTFNQFDPSLGTLNSVTISLSGNATYSGTDVDQFLGVTASTDSQVFLSGLHSGVTGGSGTFAISFSGTTNLGMSAYLFEGTGMEALTLQFNDPTTNVTVTRGNGSVSYNYTPTAVAATPEPSSLVLLGTGLLGVVGTL